MYQLKDVKVVREERVILNVEDLTIDPNALTVVLGHNGSGKSTLVNLLANQFAPEEGEVMLNQQKLTALNAKEFAKKVAFLPQKLPEVAGLNVEELVRLGRYPWRGVLGRFNKDDAVIIEDSMLKTGVNEFRNTLEIGRAHV